MVKGGRADVPVVLNLLIWEQERRLLSSPRRAT